MLNTKKQSETSINATRNTTRISLIVVNHCISFISYPFSPKKGYRQLVLEKEICFALSFVTIEAVLVEILPIMPFVVGSIHSITERDRSILPSKLPSTIQAPTTMQRSEHDGGSLHASAAMRRPTTRRRDRRCRRL